MKTLGIVVLAVAASLALASFAAASEKLAKDTGQQCVACHDKPGSKLLTDRGKYFEARKTLDGYDQIRSSFGRCTACHVRKPGSTKLTKRGAQFAENAKDMTDLKRWLDEGHAMPQAK